MCKDGDKTGIVGRLRSEISGVLFAGEERSLIRPRTAIRLYPFPARAVDCPNPQAHLSTEGRVGHFQYDAAHVLVGEVVVTGKLQIVECALYVKEKGIAPPAGKEAVVPALGHPRIQPSRDWRALDNDLPVVAYPGSLCALNAAKRRSLRSVFVRGETDSICDIGDGIAVGINPEFIDGLSREGLVCCRSWRIHAGRRMHIHN